MAELHYHASIQEQLIALSELDEAFGPSELICGWYDDLYFPAELACPKGYPQDTWDRGQREWRDCFTDHELAVLAEFHQVFERSEEHTSELQSLMRISYAVFCLKKKKQ